MPSLGVPRPYRAPLADLARLPDDQAAALAERVAELPPYSPVTEIQEVFGTAGLDDPAALAAALLSLRGLFRTMSAEELGNSLADSPDLGLEAHDREAVSNRISQLLQTAAVSTTAVAVDLQTQHERNFQGARILTDLRPVFPDDVDKGPTGAVVVQMLQLQTWDRDGGSETIFVALDEKDLVQLHEVVDRGLRKSAALRTFLDEKGLAYFQLEESEE